jgi:hypothetical protein
MSRLARSLCLVLAACRAASPPGPGPGPAPMPESAPARPVTAPDEARVAFRPLPPAPAIPTHAQIADAVAAGFPAAARARAREALATIVLPWDLRGLPTADQPRRLVEVAYQDLVDLLGQVPPERRLASLEGLVCESRSGRVLAGAMGLGVARWMLERPGRTPDASWAEFAAPFAGLDRAAVIAEAERRRAELEAVEQGADEVCRERMRLDLLHAQLALGSARTGSFATSAGPFTSFLHSVGEPTHVLQIH